MTSIGRKIRDAADVVRRARSLGEVAKALLPPERIARRVLNEGPAGDAPQDPSELGAALKRFTNRLKGEALSDDGRAVDYRALRGSAWLDELRETARRLQHLTPGAFDTDAERIAFWINLYNVLVVHGIVELGIERSVMEVPSFFSTVAYRIGGFTFTPDDIENGVLRRNGRHPATRNRLFGASDDRLRFAPTAVDARIHVALVCAARGCPPIAFYSPATLDAELELAAHGFVNADAEVFDERRWVEVSAIFRYYPEDFGGDEGVRAFLLRYAAAPLRAELERAFDAGYPLEHRRYDWDLNVA